MKYIFLICVLIIQINSCFNRQHRISNAEKKSISGNSELNIYIPDSIYSFFPRTKDKAELLFASTNAENIDITYSPAEFDVAYLIKVYKYNKANQFKSEVKTLSQNSISTFGCQSNQYFIIESERELSKHYNNKTLRGKYIYHQDSSNIIFSFKSVFNRMQELQDTTTICGLKKDFKIHVMKQGKKYILPDKHKYNWPILPEKIKHGYSSGVAYNEKELIVIFWAVAW